MSLGGKISGRRGRPPANVLILGPESGEFLVSRYRDIIRDDITISSPLPLIRLNHHLNHQLRYWAYSCWASDAYRTCMHGQAVLFTC